MLPLVGIATTFIPELIKLLAGDQAGKIAGTVAQAVSTATGTTDPAAAQKKLDEDPAAAAALRIKLAEIALEATKLQNEKEAAERAARLQAEDKQRQDALTLLRTQFENEQKIREERFAQLQAQMKADLDNTANARAMQVELVKEGGPLKWAPAVVSILVTLLFATAVLVLLYMPSAQKSAYADLVNICIGALVAGFSTVISYWLGSSQGSREKDVAAQQMQVAQAAQTARQFDVSAQQTKEIIKASTAAQRERADSPSTPAPAPAAPKGSNFDTCLMLVLGSEGGFSNDPRDKGGATNFGITIGTLTAWRRSKSPDAVVTPDDVKALKVEEAKEIYRSNYWNLMRCDDLPRGVDLLVFDMGVNAGPGTSARILQHVLGVEQDGSIGPVTVHALGLHEAPKIIREFSAKRLEHYRSLDDFATFGAGWTNRTHAMEEAALRMAGA